MGTGAAAPEEGVAGSIRNWMWTHVEQWTTAAAVFLTLSQVVAPKFLDWVLAILLCSLVYMIGRAKEVHDPSYMTDRLRAWLWGHVSQWSTMLAVFLTVAQTVSPRIIDWVLSAMICGLVFLLARAKLPRRL